MNAFAIPNHTYRSQRGFRFAQRHMAGKFQLWAWVFRALLFRKPRRVGNVGRQAVPLGVVGASRTRTMGIFLAVGGFVALMATTTALAIQSPTTLAGDPFAVFQAAARSSVLLSQDAPVSSALAALTTPDVLDPEGTGDGLSLQSNHGIYNGPLMDDVAFPALEERVMPDALTQPHKAPAVDERQTAPTSQSSHANTALLASATSPSTAIAAPNFEALGALYEPAPVAKAQPNAKKAASKAGGFSWTAAFPWFNKAAVKDGDSPGHASAVSRRGFVMPLARMHITSPFGRRWGRQHQGIDIAAPVGTPIRAVKTGVVTTAAWHSGYGNLVIIDHGNGLKTRYAHLSRIRVSAGQQVSSATRIGDVGSTGHSTGPHLHFEVVAGGIPQNPKGYLLQ